MKWKSFESRVNAMPQDKQEAQHKKAQDFFQFSRRELLKMFDRWIDTRLFFLAAFGEAPTGKLVARYLLSTEVITKSERYVPTSSNQEYHLQVTNEWTHY
jgi:hypothetical protein